MFNFLIKQANINFRFLDLTYIRITLYLLLDFNTEQN